MTTDATRANDKTLPNLQRRRLLIGLAASTAAPTVALAKTEAISSGGDEIEENPELVEAWHRHRDAEAEYHKAKDDLGWLADEWKHLWPLAPEEILGAANATGYGPYADKVERDIIGRPMMRDTNVLTKRLSKSFRQENEQTCFYLDQADELAKSLADWRTRKPGGRTEKALERNRKWSNEIIAKLETQLRLAKEYEAETQRVREAAGVDAAKQRIETAEKNLDAAAVAISKIPSRTLVGLRLKADIFLYSLERYSIPRNDRFIIFGALWRLVEDTLDATQDLDGKRMALPLPASKGGAE